MHLILFQILNLQYVVFGICFVYFAQVPLLLNYPLNYCSLFATVCVAVWEHFSDVLSNIFQLGIPLGNKKNPQPHHRTWINQGAFTISEVVKNGPEIECTVHPNFKS